MVDPEVTIIITAVSQALTALGVILTAANSMANRRKLTSVERKVDNVATKAEEVKVAAVTQLTIAHAATMEKMEEVKEAAIAVNAEVIKEVRDGTNGNGKQ